MKKKEDNQCSTLSILLKTSTPKETILKFLAESDIKKNTQAQRLVQNDNSGEATIELIDFLTDCIRHDIHKNAVWSILETLNNVGGHFGQILAQSQDPSTLKHFLHFFNNLMASGVSATDLFLYLKMRNDSNWSMATIIIHKHMKVESIYQILITLISNFMKQGVTPDDIVKLLKFNVYDQWTFGHYIVRYHNHAIVLDYIILVNNCLKGGASTESIMGLLEQKTNQGWEIGHIIYVSQKDNIKQNYLRLLIRCSRKGASSDALYTLLMSKTPQGIFEKSILSESVHLSNPLTLYLLINTKLLQDKDYKVISCKQDIILDYILSLPQRERTIALKHANNENHALGKFFRTKDSIFADPSVYISKIERALQEAERIKTNSSTMTMLALMPIYTHVHGIKNVGLRQNVINAALKSNQHLEKIEDVSAEYVHHNTGLTNFT